MSASTEGGPPAGAGDGGRWITLGLLLYPLLVWGLAARLGLPWADAAFLGALLELLPLLAVLQVPPADDAELARIPAYVASAFTICLLGGIAAALGGRAGGPEALGLRAMAPLAWVAWSAGLTAAGLLLLVGFHRLRRRLGLGESPLLIRLLPVSAREKAVFATLSVAAGLGEEITFRGYAMTALAPHLGGPWGSALFTSVVFGILHAYQGMVGMARTALMGFLLAAAVLVSGSLWPAVTAHVAIDLVVGLVLADRLTR